MCAGQLIDCLGVAGGTALPGTACDDGNANSSNDEYGANCVCAGTLPNDCLGVPGGPAQPGTSCDDGLATTGNDVYDANCVCAGQLIDCLGVIGGTTLPGTSCNDNNACTLNDVYQANCQCAGTPSGDSDNDGTCDALDICANGPEPGAVCNDNNPLTTNDVIQSDCSCAGIPVVNCSNYILTIATDNVGSETTWQILDNSNNSVVDAGGPYASNTLTNETVCLPIGGCFQLIVTDVNGMSSGSTGGYVLADQSGRRVIDNAGDGVFTGTSQVGIPFCDPVGADGLIQAQCDKVDWIPNQFLIATPNGTVSAQYPVSSNGNLADDGYEFWLFDPDGTYNRFVYQSHANTSVGAPPGATAACHLNYSALVTNPVPQNILLNIRVRSRVNGVFSAWGGACRFKIDQQAAACPLTNLVTLPGTEYSCGATGKVVGAAGAPGRIYAKQASRIVGGVSQQANRYWFDLTETNSGYTRSISVTTRTLVLGQWYTAPLLCGTYTYNVRVRASFDGGATWCPFGTTCPVTITNNLASPFCSTQGSAMADSDDRVFYDGDEAQGAAILTMWPNPNRGDQLYVTVDHLDGQVSMATVDIFDMVGKKVATRSIPVNGTTLNTVIELNGSVANGMYLVNVTTGDQTMTQRLVIQ
ncbi:MAG: T9SS type A sorting domain-containing protein [Flavobacteriales bacterium]|nr:T9SS type A sorting domain-containing protein [Flavobacteriales bacterium]